MSQHGRILLVDHSRGAMLFQETILRRRGTSVTTALACSEGLVKARDERPHLIILGFDLFDMTAPEFCRAIRGPGLAGMFVYARSHLCSNLVPRRAARGACL